MLQINKYWLPTDQTFGNGSRTVDIYDCDFNLKSDNSVYCYLWLRQVMSFDRSTKDDVVSPVGPVNLSATSTEGIMQSSVDAAGLLT